MLGFDVDQHVPLVNVDRANNRSWQTRDAGDFSDDVCGRNEILAAHVQKDRRLAFLASGASRTLIYLYLEPVGAMILAALFLGERLTPLQALGGALALVGVALVRRA